ncbi:MAG: molybdopterin-dependent oxidoreductase, partial [Acidimicrobiia bacterium]|nr:molybdopterin-dependent oxidoreductase [Acidimicrobiia bacterium]
SIVDVAEFPVVWTEQEAVLDPESAMAPGAHQIHESRSGNVLVEGYVARGDLEAGFNTADVVVESEYTTVSVEHAYIEPEAGFATRVADRIEIQASTQTPHMDRTEIAAILGIDPDAVRIIPTAVGGGFGSKLDLSVQPFLAVAAWHLDRPVRITYTRPESMMSTTKRHPSRLRARVGATSSGDLIAMDFSGTFDTGAYASWGPTVANRAPVHAGGPYVYRAYRARTRAVHTNAPPAGAFRGFGVPQSAVCQESLFDELADAVGIDRLEFRIRNALTAGQPTVTGQVFESGVGFRECLEALRPGWANARAEAAEFNRSNGERQRGVGVAGMWYGCGNTALPNPSTMKVGLHRDGRIVVFQGAVDIGQGANTAMLQICADTLGMDIAALSYVGADTDTTPDAGKTSASRQTFVSGNALFEASRRLRLEILEMTHASEDAHFELTDRPLGGSTTLIVHDRGETREFELNNLPADPAGFVALTEATYDPPTSPLDENGQGDPYAVFGFGAQMAELEIDTRLGTVRLIRITAAHDVGRAVNPTLIEGQIEGGIAQGIGMALMEEYVPGRNENLHDYLIPTFGDVPEVVNILIESNDPIGPYGAKGIGEHTLIPTAPAILNAIRDAAGAPVRNLPATPARILEAIRQGGSSS